MEKIAHRYAKALVSVAEKHKKLDHVLKDLDDMEMLIKESVVFRDFLNNRLLPSIKSKNILEKIFAKSKLDPHIKTMIFNLAKLCQLSLLQKIITEYRKIVYKKRNIVPTLIESAFTIPQKSMDSLKNLLEKKFLKKLIIQNKINKKILGGFKIHIEHYIFDFSVENRLHNLVKIIKETKLSG